MHNLQLDVCVCVSLGQCFYQNVIDVTFGWKRSIEILYLQSEEGGWCRSREKNRYIEDYNHFEGCYMRV
jgi:hypothetical protein